mmetsp:Transcript_71835/g.120432  ORF Transcript_71835/g.120432 Transcript_71835/m.120432 type:complete len:104 (-) Transcript_71835:3052-3363(-)
MFLGGPAPHTHTSAHIFRGASGCQLLPSPSEHLCPKDKQTLEEHMCSGGPSQVDLQRIGPHSNMFDCKQHRADWAQDTLDPEQYVRPPSHSCTADHNAKHHPT